MENIKTGLIARLVLVCFLSAAIMLAGCADEEPGETIPFPEPTVTTEPPPTTQNTPVPTTTTEQTSQPASTSTSTTDPTPGPTSTPATTSAPTTTPDPTTETTTTTSEPGPDEEDLVEVLDRTAGITSIKYDMVFTGVDGEVTTATYWEKNDRMRYDASYEDMSGVMIVDRGEQEQYLYVPDENTAIRFSYDPEETEESKRQETREIADFDYEIEGIEVLEGKECLVVTYIDNGAEVTVWLWIEKAFPVKMETTTSEGTSTAEFKNIDFGDIDDSVFEIPEGVNIIDASLLPGA